jgi:hypothetical protein
MSEKFPEENGERASPRPASRPAGSTAGRPVNCLLIVVAAMALVCGLGIIAGRPLLDDVLRQSTIHTPTRVTHKVSMAELQNVAKLVSTEYYLVDEVHYTQIPDNVSQYLGFKKEFLALVYGTVAAGFDLTDWSLEDNLWQDGMQVMLKLPPPQVLYVDMDFERSHIVDTGGWCPVGCPEPVTDYLDKALPEAEGRLKEQAVEYGLLEQTAKSGRDYFYYFLVSEDFTDVRVIVDGYIYE